MLRKRTTGRLVMNVRLAKVASFHIREMDGGRFGGDYSISAASTLLASTESMSRKERTDAARLCPSTQCETCEG